MQGVEIPESIEMEEEKERREVKEEAMERITERLSALENLYFPQALLSKAATPSLRKPLLLDLLRRDVPVFLGNHHRATAPLLSISILFFSAIFTLLFARTLCC